MVIGWLRIGKVMVDLLLLIGAYLITMLWLPLTNQEPFAKYNSIFIFFVLVWVLVSFLNMKYKNEEETLSVWIFRSVFTAVIVCLFFLLFLPSFKTRNFSIYVLFAVPGITLLGEITFLSVWYAFKGAKNKRENSSYIPVNNVWEGRSRSSKLFKFLNKRISFEEDEVNIFNGSDVLNIFHLNNKKYFLHLERFNRVKEPNLFLSLINLKLVHNGIFIGCFESKNARKKRILSSSSWGLNYFVYIYDYLYKRFFPNFYLTSSLFSLLYTKTDRIFSKAEMYGRLYCAGFEFVEDCKIDGITWFVFRKTGKPQRYSEPFIGSLIGLDRIGKDGKVFTEYKLRTMYPYSEYLQPFMILNNRLREGGKIKRDVRITRIGSICRRLWIDELPQFINLCKGDLKLVGVRPLSSSYFNLYNVELQKERVKHKPGILPPFYADMPKTLEEIQASEMKYLKECEERGTFITDLKYLWIIFINIVFKRARSK
jgi:lipopolysaccharide/colanic/teichoic acid biosynthesis glycosyltransferase